MQPAAASAAPVPAAHQRSWSARLKARLSARLQRSWAKRDWLAVALYDVSLLYRGLVALRRWLYARGIFESARLPVPVIVVGNVVAGGAGKTPVVIEIVQHLQRAGWQPGVVSRGYGRVDVTRGNNRAGVTRGNNRAGVTHGNNRAGVPHGDNRAGAPDGGPDDSGCLAVTQDTPVALSGDEPALVHRATGAPVWVGADRPNAALALLAAHPSVNVIVSDDGLQHLALQRDIEICVFDDRGVGNGWLLPAGPLREPWPRSSKSNEPWPRSSKPGEPWPRSSKSGEPWPRKQAVDFVLSTGAQPPANSNSNAPVFHRITRQLAPYAVRADGSRTALADLQGQALHAVAAIAQPEAFFSMLRQQGLTLARTTALPDHYDFNSWLSSIYGPEPLICTEKDAVKLWPMYPQALAVPLVVNLPADFLAALLARLVALPTPPDPAD